ncbi:phage protease [Micromonospora haikouensis]|uniref:phage protease n=1 Tax=Micromonospora haikouensis TaxID=686309 RepID=UPI00342462A0
MPTDTTRLARRDGVELVRTGTWQISTGQWTASRQDLAAAVAALSCPAVRKPVLKVGHTDKRFTPGDGEPAIGWVDNMRLADGGHTLVGDYVGVPAWLNEVMASAYPDRSVEGTYNHRCQLGHTHPFVLTGVALLGVTPPGVGTLSSLNDVRALYGIAAAAPQPSHGEVQIVASVQAANDSMFSAFAEAADTFTPDEGGDLDSQGFEMPGPMLPVAAAGDGKLRDYWLRGEGAAKIRWRTDGDFTRCVRHLSKYVSDPQGLCAEYHHEATGMWPGDRRNVHAGVAGDEVAAHQRGQHDQSKHGNRFNTPGDRSSGLRSAGKSRSGPSRDLSPEREARIRKDLADVQRQLGTARWDVEILKEAGASSEDMARQKRQVNDLEKQVAEHNRSLEPFEKARREEAQKREAREKADREARQAEQAARQAENDARRKAALEEIRQRLNIERAAEDAALPPTDQAVAQQIETQSLSVTKRLARLPKEARANPPSDATALRWGGVGAGRTVADSNGRVIGRLSPSVDADQLASGGWIRVDTGVPSAGGGRLDPSGRLVGRHRSVSVWKPPTRSGMAASVQEEDHMPNPTPDRIDLVRDAWNRSAPHTQWIIEVHASHLIVTDEKDRSFHRVPVSIDGEHVTFGEPVHVMPGYVEQTEQVAATAVFASRDESRPNPQPVDAPASPTVDPPRPAPVDTTPPDSMPAPELPAAEPEPNTDPKEDPVSTLSTDVRSRLGLTEDADDNAVMAALDALHTKATAQPDTEQVAASAKAENDELRKEVQVLASQVQTMSTRLAAAEAEKTATVKASILDEAQRLGKFTPADRERWEKDYDDAPAVVTRVLASIAAGTAVPTSVSGYTGSADSTVDLDAEWERQMAALDGPTATTGGN